MTQGLLLTAIQHWNNRRFSKKKKKERKKERKRKKLFDKISQNYTGAHTQKQMKTHKTG